MDQFSISFELLIKSAFRNSKLAILLWAMLFALGLPAAAQQPNKLPRIGLLSTVSLFAQAARIEAFHQGLRELRRGEKHCH